MRACSEQAYHGSSGCSAVLVDSQHGFRRSCKTLLLLTFPNLTSVVNKCGLFDMLILGFEKAFEPIAYKRLLVKLKCYSFNNGRHTCIEAFFLNLGQL